MASRFFYAGFHVTLRLASRIQFRHQTSRVDIENRFSFLKGFRYALHAILFLVVLIGSGLLFERGR